MKFTFDVLDACLKWSAWILILGANLRCRPFYAGMPSTPARECSFSAMWRSTAKAQCNSRPRLFKASRTNNTFETSLMYFTPPEAKRERADGILPGSGIRQDAGASLNVV